MQFVLPRILSYCAYQVLQELCLIVLIVLHGNEEEFPRISRFLGCTKPSRCKLRSNNKGDTKYTQSGDLENVNFMSQNMWEFKLTCLDAWAEASCLDGMFATKFPSKQHTVVTQFNCNCCKIVNPDLPNRSRLLTF